MLLHLRIQVISPRWSRLIRFLFSSKSNHISANIFSFDWAVLLTFSLVASPFFSPLPPFLPNLVVSLFGRHSICCERFSASSILPFFFTILSFFLLFTSILETFCRTALVLSPK